MLIRLLSKLMAPIPVARDEKPAPQPAPVAVASVPDVTEDEDDYRSSAYN